jgi:ABC-type transporter MlaC component
MILRPSFPSRRAFLAGVSAFALAAPGGALASPDGARDFIQKLGERALTTMKSRQDRREAVRKLIDDGLDVEALGRFALGPFLRQSNPRRVEEYLAVFRDYVMMAYPDMLAKFDLRNFEIVSTKDLGDASFVTTTIEYGDNDKAELAWYVREVKPGQYKIQDVQLEGYSLRAFQRAKFEKILRERWIDGLIRILHNWIKAGREEPYF